MNSSPFLAKSLLRSTATQNWPVSAHSHCNPFFNDSTKYPEPWVTQSLNRGLKMRCCSEKSLSQCPFFPHGGSRTVSCLMVEPETQPRSFFSSPTAAFPSLLQNSLHSALSESRSQYIYAQERMIRQLLVFLSLYALLNCPSCSTSPHIGRASAQMGRCSVVLHKCGCR